MRRHLLQNKDDPNGLWGDWRQDPLGLPKGVQYKGSRMQALAAMREKATKESPSPLRQGRDKARRGGGDGDMHDDGQERSEGGGGDVAGASQKTRRGRQAHSRGEAGQDKDEPMHGHARWDSKSVFPTLPVALPSVPPSARQRDNGFGGGCGV